MPRIGLKPEEIVAKLRQADVLFSQGKSAPDAGRSISMFEVKYCRWRQEFSDLKTYRAQGMEELEAESSSLRRAMSDLWLEKMILADPARENW